MKFKNQIFLSLLGIILCMTWCLPNQDPIEENEKDQKTITLSDTELSKLSYILQGVMDFSNDEENQRNTPLKTDEQKGKLVFNFLNANYMDKYEEQREHQETDGYPYFEDTFIENKGDSHDGVFPIDINKSVKIQYQKSDIDTILKEVIGSTIKDWKNINKEGMILSGDVFILYTYKYYGEDLIGNKGRWTYFTIDQIQKTNENEIIVDATYQDDAFIEDTNCKLSYKITENPQSFYGYTINAYRYQWCKYSDQFSRITQPLLYGIINGIYTDEKELKDLKSVEINIDLDHDGVNEYFKIGPDSPNGTTILGVYGTQGENFIYDFKSDITDAYNDLLDGLFAEIYFENIDEEPNLEVIIMIGDKKTRSEINIYKVQNQEFKNVWHLNGKSYGDYESQTQTLHLPYSNNGECKQYKLINGEMKEQS